MEFLHVMVLYWWDRAWNLGLWFSSSCYWWCPLCRLTVNSVKDQCKGATTVFKEDFALVLLFKSIF